MAIHVERISRASRLVSEGAVSSMLIGREASGRRWQGGRRAQFRKVPGVARQLRGAVCPMGMRRTTIAVSKEGRRLGGSACATEVLASSLESRKMSPAFVLSPWSEGGRFADSETYDIVKGLGLYCCFASPLISNSFLRKFRPIPTQRSLLHAPHFPFCSNHDFCAGECASYSSRRNQ